MMPNDQPGRIYPIDIYQPAAGRRAFQHVNLPGSSANWIVEVIAEEPMGQNYPPVSIKVNLMGPGGGYRSIDFDDPRYARAAELATRAFNGDNFLDSREAQEIAQAVGLEIVPPLRGRVR